MNNINLVTDPTPWNADHAALWVDLQLELTSPVPRAPVYHH